MKKSTATPYVQEMNPAFDMKPLPRTRRIWLCLPPEYATSRRAYPVIYMQDGQNLFDSATAFAGEWGIDKYMATLSDEQNAIIVGIENGSDHRLAEYTPIPHPTHGGGEAKSYLDFIAHTLKPYIDSHYRTKPEREHTCLWGSSLGGILAFWGAVTHPHVFGKIGAFSPSFWIVPDWAFHIEQAHYQPEPKVYILGGTRESKYMVKHCQTAAKVLRSKGFSRKNVKLTIVEGGIHNEHFWGVQFPQAYEYLMLS
jgi:predicted alpha/beta superfamily hydrolase